MLFKLLVCLIYINIVFASQTHDDTDEKSIFHTRHLSLVVNSVSLSDKHHPNGDEKINTLNINAIKNDIKNNGGGVAPVDYETFQSLLNLKEPPIQKLQKKRFTFLKTSRSQSMSVIPFEKKEEKVVVTQTRVKTKPKGMDLTIKVNPKSVGADQCLITISDDSKGFRTVQIQSNESIKLDDGQFSPNAFIAEINQDARIQQSIEDSTLLNDPKTWKATIQGAVDKYVSLKNTVLGMLVVIFVTYLTVSNEKK
jgi:hypothetical protein